MICAVHDPEVMGAKSSRVEPGMGSPVSKVNLNQIYRHGK